MKHTSVCQRQLVLITLLVTLAAGATACLLNRPTPEPSPTVTTSTQESRFEPPPIGTPVPPTATPALLTDDPLRGAWWDYFENGYRVGEVEGIYRAEEGARLSRLHDLGSPVPGTGEIQHLATTDDGRLIGVARVLSSTWPFTKTRRMFLYSPSDDLFVDLGDPFSPEQLIGALVVGHDDRVYIGVGSADREAKTDDHLFSYDLNSRRVQDLGIPPVGSHSIYNLVVAPNGRVFGRSGNHLFCYDPITDQFTDLGKLQLGDEFIRGFAVSDEGWVYGIASSHWLFEYDLATQEVISLTDYVWAPYFTRIVLSTDGKLYGQGYNDGLFSYDPASNVLTDLGNPMNWDEIDELAPGSDGSIYGLVVDYPAYERFLFRYSPAAGEIAYLELVDTYEFAVAADGRIYIAQSYQKFVQDRRFEGGGHNISVSHVWVYEPDAYSSVGVVKSELIEPNPLAVIRAEVGDEPAMVPAMAWGSDGLIYGALSSTWPQSANWLFRYDPLYPKHVEWIDLTSLNIPGYSRATALAATPDGRFVAAIGTQLLTFDPQNDTLVTATVPISQPFRITALTVGHDGSVYGSTEPAKSTYWDARASHLFVYSPTTGIVVDIGTPFTPTHHIYALTTAPDGRIYGGGGLWLPSRDFTLAFVSPPDSPILFAYDPVDGAIASLGTVVTSTERVHSLLTTPDGKLYVGTGRQFWGDGHFYSYDPMTDSLVDLGLSVRGDVSVLTLDSDGLIYGSMTEDYHGSRIMRPNYGDSYIFRYDPRSAGQHPTLVSDVPFHTAVTALLPGSDGTMYGAIGLRHACSNFQVCYQGTAELIAFRTGCPSGLVEAWERVTWEAETPCDTAIVVDVLNREGDVLLHDVQNGASLGAIDPISNTAISLRATLSTHDERVTPVLKSWRVDYVFQCQE